MGGDLTVLFHHCWLWDLTDDKRESFLLVISRGLEGGNAAAGQSLTNNYVNLKMRGQNVDNAFVETRVGIETINPQHVGTEVMREDSWGKRRGEAGTKNFYEIHEQKANCCDRLCYGKD